jgi:aryl-alcohol dehydrogenase-like predicted oxidoreductase
LQTDYVDLYQAHRFDATVPLEETMTAFADLVRAGKALYIGVSEWRAEEIAAGAELARDLGIQLISNQPQYSMLWRVIEEEVVPTSEREGLSQIVWSPLAQGVLTGKYLPGAAPLEGSRATGVEAEEMSWLLRDDVLTPVQGYAELCRQAGYTPASVALAWVLQNENVSSAIIGASRPEQIAENVKALDIDLEPDFVAAVESVLEPTTLFDPGFTFSPNPRP